MATGTVIPFDVGNQRAFAIRPADYVDSKALTAGVAESFTVPALGHICLLSATADLYVNYTTTATVAGDVTNGTASELNPTMRLVTPAATISVISEGACSVTASYWRI